MLGGILASDRPELDSARWERAVVIFERALDADPGARESIIRDEAGDDDALASIVRSMLAADENSVELIDAGVENFAHLAFAADQGRSAGDQIGDFEIISELGRGGMGIVYAARDQTLGRVAALKLLPVRNTADSAADAQLIAEAQAASALDHPNVATIYQIGKTDDGRRFIAMARYEGETLRERLRRGALKPRDAFDILKQVAAGLAAAHSAGLVHRDVKPENIFITTHGLVKLLDFGIATLSGSPRDGPTTRGTVLYMSPEQARRQVADSSTDVWSLGIVLHEMLTGAPPYTGTSAAEVLDQIASPAPIRFPSAIRQLPSPAVAVLSRALEKDSTKRFANATELLKDLEHVEQRWTRPRQIRIGLAAAAVLIIVAGYAFKSFGRDAQSHATPELAVLVSGDSSDRETTELASALGREIAARVVGLRRVTLVHPSKGAESTVLSRPGLHLLRLEIERADNGPVINASLDRSTNGKALWSERRTFARRELRELGRDVVIGVLDALGKPVTDRERGLIGSSFPSSAEAYDEFLQGNRLLAIRTPASVESALLKYRRASQLDTTFASAFARQSYSYSLLVDWGWKPTRAFPADPLAEGLALADRAASLDSTSADAWLARAYILVLRDPQRMIGSAEAFQRSITLDPYNAEAYHQYGQALMALGRYTEALAAYRRVVDLEPDRAMTLVPMAAIHGRLGRPFEGLRLMDSAISASPNVPYARATRSLFRAATGDVAGAKEDAEFALSLDPAYPIPALGALVKALWMSGDTAAALSRLRQAEAAVIDKTHPSYTEAYWLAIAEVAAGRSEQALELLMNTKPQGAYAWFLFQGGEFVEFRKIPAVAARLAGINPRRAAP